MKWLHAARARLRLLAPRAANSRIDEEIRFHIEMETERLVRDEKLEPDEARRRALVAFGGAQQHRETLRNGRGTAWLSGLSLDLKLGFRMLVKYPGLTVVGGLAMAFGIGFGAIVFQMLGTLDGEKVPLPDGDRIVRIQNVDLKTSQDEDRVLFDYQLWRSARSITDLGAYRDASVNVVGADGNAQPALAAEVTPSAFRIAPAAPLRGRVLNDADERAGADPVVVLGHEVWTERFGGDPQIVGRTVQLGSSFATVVGVMPEGYAFPVAHQLWLPLRTNVAGVEPRRGIAIHVFGRLAAGATRKNAQAELTTFGQRLAAEHPTTHAQIRPHVIPYAKMSVESPEMVKVRALIYFFVIALVTVVCSTVALLIFARAAARETEILVRSALGASRRRIVTQLFAETLVLAGVAVVVGLAAAQFALTRWGALYIRTAMDTPRLPFWYEFSLSPKTVVYALALAVIGAVVAGVMPARKITRGLGTQLRAGTTGGGVSFGGVWTAVLVTQVALTVVFPAVAMFVRGESNRIGSYDTGFPAQQYLGVNVSMDVPPAETRTPEARAALGVRFSTSLEALRQRLETEPGVSGVTFVDQLPRDYHSERRAQLASQAENQSRWVSTASIHPSYFDVLQAPLIAGRTFNSGDLAPGARVVIVDKGFADLVMPGRNPLGQRVRVSAGWADSIPSQWASYEIVGVAKELGMAHVVERSRPAGVYMPFVPGPWADLSVIVRGRGDPLPIGPRVRALATSIDPALRIDEMMRLDQVATPMLWFLGLWMRIIIALTAITLLLSLAGIYAVLSYVVSRRTREIGVRVALGASSRGVIMSVFKRPLTQVSLGVVAGIGLIATAAIAIQYTEDYAGIEPQGMSISEVGLLAGYAILMLGVCALACVVPTMRALRVQPTVALRAE